MENLEQNAIESFRNGLNCAQAVFSAFSEKLGFDREMALQTSVGFGGGMGRLQETCGAVTGAFMAIGIHISQQHEDNALRKGKSYEMIREFNARFTEKHNTIKCLDLIQFDMNTEKGRALIKQNRVHETICEACITNSVLILNELISS